MAEKTPTRQEILDDLELRKKQLELRRLEGDVQRLEMGDQVANAAAKRNAITLAKNEEEQRKLVLNCNHHKGGKGMEGFKGNGNDAKYAVIKHQFPNSDFVITCSRCNNIWLPPVEPLKDDFEGKELYQAARLEFSKSMRQYNEALSFQTDNETSTSGLWRFPDGGREYRKVLHESEGIPYQQCQKFVEAGARL